MNGTLAIAITISPLGIPWATSLAYPHTSEGDLATPHGITLLAVSRSLVFEHKIGQRWLESPQLFDLAHSKA
jgi:hypothetical protein